MVDATPKRMSSLDRISDLPESIISVILSSLPTKDAVATSILSRSWRFRWTRITGFNFETPKNQFRKIDAAHFSDFVNMVLLKHCGESINKFVLRWESSHLRAVQINSWADVAIARYVRVLDLNTESMTGQGEFYLPFSLYTSGTLEILKLEGPFRIKPPSMACLPKLVEIKLRVVVYESDESLPALLSASPLLKSLKIIRITKSDNMVVCSISSPALKRLSIGFYGLSLREEADKELKIDAPKLEYLDLFDSFSSHISIQPRLSSAIKLSLDVLTYHDKAVELLRDFGAVKFLSIKENQVTGSNRLLLRVSFKGVAKYLYRSDLPWSCMMDVLDSCVNLEELEIWCFESNYNVVGRGPRTLLSSLKCLTLRNFIGRKKEMEMLKFFLDHGLVMETVTLSSYKPKFSVVEAKKKIILNEVAKFSRASPTCKISWYDFPGPKSCFQTI